MGIIVLYLLLVTTVVRSFKYQQTAVYAYYLMSIMAPQFIWFWVFEGVMAFTIAAGTAIAVFMWQVLNKKIDYSVYRYKQNILIVIFWTMFNLSDVLVQSAHSGQLLVLFSFLIFLILFL